MKRYSSMLVMALSLCLGVSSVALAYNGVLNIRTVDEQGDPFPFIVGGFTVEGVGPKATTFEGTYYTNENGEDSQYFKVNSSSPVARVVIAGSPQYPSVCFGYSDRYVVLQSTFNIIPIEFTIHCSTY